MSTLDTSLPEDDGTPKPVLFKEPAANGNGHTNGNNNGIVFDVRKLEANLAKADSQSDARLTPEMFRQTFNGMSTFPLVADLPTDFADNVRGKRWGNMSPHMYNHAALPAWEAVTKDPDYYPAHSDAQIISDNTAYFNKLGDELRQRGDVVYIEMGVGGDYSLNHKTIPMIRALGATDAGLLDYSDSAIGHTTFELVEKCPDIKQHTLLRNFNTQSYGNMLPADKPRVFGLMGCTLGNFEGPAGINVPESLSKTFAHYRAQMNKGDILILSVDHNLDQKSLFRAYNGTFDHWVQQMKVYLAANFKGTGYNPDNFDYQKVWDTKNHLLMFGFTPPKDGALKIDGIGVPYQAKRMQVHLNSRRFVQGDLNEAYKRTEIVDVATSERKGLELVDVLPDRQKFISLQVLRAT